MSSRRGSRRAATACFYILGDPYSRFDACKIGITNRLENRLINFYCDNKRHVYLPDGFTVFALYLLPNWQQAEELERAVLRYFKDHKKWDRSLGWLELKPGMVDVSIDVIADDLGLEWEQIGFPYVRWYETGHVTAWRQAGVPG